MIIESGRNEEITAWASKITQGDYSNKFVPEFAHMLTQLTEKDWERIEWFMKGLVDQKVSGVQEKEDAPAMVKIPDTPEELERLYPPIDISGRSKSG